jgi:hypothetical protein
MRRHLSDGTTAVPTCAEGNQWAAPIGQLADLGAKTKEM